MSTEPLPSTLDVRKAAARGVSISGALQPHQLPRFLPLLAGDQGEIDVVLAFYRDEENRHLVQVTVQAKVTVICQRCLEPMATALSSNNTLAIVWTDEQAAHLPRHLDPLIVTEEGGNLWELVEDELMLALPSFSYHETDECKAILAGYAGSEVGEVAEEKPNPFDVLALLKPGKEN